MVAEENANLIFTIRRLQKGKLIYESQSEDWIRRSQPISDNLINTEKTNPLVIDRRLEKGNLFCKWQQLDKREN
jgi:hypothetical protein